MRFTKMHGAGNDFVVLDFTQQAFSLSAEQLRKIADRHLGIGADQVLVVEKPRAKGVDFRYRIFNADGGEVEQCGNGARCFVKFVRDRKLTDKREIRVETLGGTIAPRLEADGEVSVDMGPPDIEAPLVQVVKVKEQAVKMTLLSMGNPHAVQVVRNVEKAPVRTQGPLLEHHARFPNRVNAGYMQVLDRGSIALRVWERGAGETLACGTGACAAVVAGIRLGWLDATVDVHTRGGLLTIEWPGGEASVLMTGPAQTVYEGEIDL
jgi:diaminopimelate epimerase